MHTSVLLLAGSLFYLILVMFIYFSKQRLDSIENKIYKYILISALVGIILDLFGIYASLNIPDTHFIRFIALKGYYQYLLTILLLFTLYIFLPSLMKSDNKLKKESSLLGILYVGASILNFILPFEFYKNGKIIYVTGANTIFLYGLAGIVILIWIIYIVVNCKKVNTRRLLPIIIFIIFSIPIIYYQMLNPEALLITALITFIVIYMYFTIENPDLKMIESLSKSKEIAESSNNEKEIFLFDMSQRLKMPIKDIEHMSEEALNSNNQEFVRENLREINTSSKNLSNTINGLLGISASESHNIEIRNNKYSLDLLIKSIIANSKKEIEEKGLKFRTNIDNTLPKTLLGDSIRIKQIINIILGNAIKYTDKGYIELSVNTIMKYDSCRLIITIEDSGIGIESDKLYKLLENREELTTTGNNKVSDTEDTLALAKTLTSLIGGTIIASSEVGMGSKFTVILDQKVIKEEIENSDKLVEKYENSKGNLKKVLVVEPNIKVRKNLDKFLSKYNLDIEYLTYGVECLKKIRNKEECNLIIMNEELDKLSSYDTMKRLEEVSGFNVPVVVLANKKSDLIEHFDSYGFSDVINEKPNNNEISKIINKYIKNAE